jgi:hypothetical protein
MPDHAHALSAMLPGRCPDESNSRLLLFAIRRVAAGGLNDAHVANAFIGSFGLAYRRPLILLRALMAELSRVSERKIMVAPSCCPRMTTAEAAVLASVSFALDDPPGMHDLLCETLGVENCLGALSSAQALGQAFADLGRPLGSLP